MDFRWFLIGNCIAILSSLATPEQETAIMDLFEERWEDLIGEMPLKIAYPALEGSEWKTVTGCDPKNTSWSCHNGGSWPADCFQSSCALAHAVKIKKPIIDQLNFDVMHKRPENLVCMLDLEDVLPKLLNTVKVHKSFEEIVKSNTFAEFVYQTVWKPKGQKGKRDWDSLQLTQATYSNFKNGICLHSYFTREEDSNSIICRSISVWGNYIFCGYQSSETIVFKIVKGILTQFVIYPPYERELFLDRRY